MNWKKHDDFARVCHLVGQAIREYRMIDAGDRILVGLSGGKDSLLLMHVLYRLQRRSPVPFDVVSVTVDMGFKAFHAEELAAYCGQHGWRWERVRLPGRDLVREKGAEQNPCSLCSRLRRGQLHAAADRLGANKIALGQHLDDLCVSLLMSMFRGGGLKTMGANVPADRGRKRLIRPLCWVSESLILDAAAPFRFPAIGSCDYAGQLEEHGDRAFLRAELTRLDRRFPGVRHSMLHAMRDVRVTHLLDPRFLTPAEEAGGGEPEPGSVAADASGPDGDPTAPAPS